MNRTQFLTRVLASLVLVALWRNQALVPILVRDPVSLGGVLIFAYLVLSTTCIIGLLAERSWGFYLLYILVPFSTVMLSVSYVPVLVKLPPASNPWIIPLLLNAGVVALAVLVQRGRFGAQAGLLKGRA
jgi:hypothetical protein